MLSEMKIKVISVAIKSIWIDNIPNESEDNTNNIALGVDVE